MGNQEESKVPSILSTEWNDYAMGFFAEKELIDGHPLTAGLRRVAELLIGEIISSKPTNIIVTETKSPIGRTTVVYEVQFLVKKDDLEYIKTFSDVAEVWEGNTDDMFAVHAAATASTRAEGRALRKALKLRVVAAEELCKKDVSKFLGEQSDQNEDRITKDQINFIDMKCRKLDIDVAKFVNSGDKSYRSIYEVTKETAAKIIKTVTKLSTGESKVDPKFQGYKQDWNN